jgi:hypothetical protein
MTRRQTRQRGRHVCTFNPTKENSTQNTRKKIVADEENRLFRENSLSKKGDKFGDNRKNE